MRLKEIKQSHAETFLRWLLCDVDRMATVGEDRRLYPKERLPIPGGIGTRAFLLHGCNNVEKEEYSSIAFGMIPPGVPERNQPYIQVQSHFSIPLICFLTTFLFGEKLWTFYLLVKLVLDASYIVNKIIINLEQLHYYWVSMAVCLFRVHLIISLMTYWLRIFA